MKRYFYVTYEWFADNTRGWGDMLISNDFIRIYELKEAAGKAAGIDPSKIHLNILELNKEEFDFNFKEFTKNNEEQDMELKNE